MAAACRDVYKWALIDRRGSHKAQAVERLSYKRARAFLFPLALLHVCVSPSVLVVPAAKSNYITSHVGQVLLVARLLAAGDASGNLPSSYRIQFTARITDASIPRRASSPVLFVLNISYPFISNGCCGAFRCICRTIVHNDDLNVPERLIPDTVQRPQQFLFPIVRGDYNRNHKNNTLGTRYGVRPSLEALYNLHHSIPDAFKSLTG